MATNSTGKKQQPAAHAEQEAPVNFLRNIAKTFQSELNPITVTTAKSFPVAT
jgi:hypothetical protein